MKNRVYSVMSLIIILSMLCQLMSHNFIVYAADESIIYSEDFSSGKLDSEWDAYFKKGTTVFGNVHASDKNLYMSYSLKSSTRGLYAKREIKNLDVDVLDFSFDLKITPIISPKNIASAMPPSVALSPPVTAPHSDWVSTASRTPLERV